MRRVNVCADRRRIRRVASQDELQNLLFAARSGKRYLLDGPDREMLYLLAVCTGFRANELASLTPSCFALEREVPTVTVKAAYSKRRREDEQPIPKVVATILASWLTGKNLMPDERVWPGSWPNRAAKMLSRDLETAEIAVCDQRCEVFDFHSLRHTFISNLAAAGVHPKVAQALARHSTIVLTMDRYTHLERAEFGKFVQLLPSLTGNPPSVAHEDGGQLTLLTDLLTGSAAATCPDVSSADAMTEADEQKTETHNPPMDSELGVVCHPVAPNDAQGSARIRTGDGGFAIRPPIYRTVRRIATCKIRSATLTPRLTTAILLRTKSLTGGWRLIRDCNGSLRHGRC